jgi:threonylcarbamoyladenosine tRNA methylthiotransferase MtaB
LVEVSGGADLAIVNSCAVTKAAIRKDRKMIVRARRENPEARVVLIGCWPMVYGSDGLDCGAYVVVAGRTRLELDSPCSAFQSERPPSCLPVGTVIKGASLLDSALRAKQFINRGRHFLKIQDGCEQFCSYCVIPYARGKYSSRPVNDIIEEFRAVVRAGVGEIVLCGIHLGKWGMGMAVISELGVGSRKLGTGSGEKGLVRDEWGVGSGKIKPALPSLIKQLFKIKGDFRIRLSSIEINEIDCALIGLIAGNRKLCRHLHVPLQSGCDKILKLMNRPYDTAYFADRVAVIRRRIPNIALTTDVIVGFPGETDEDFEMAYGYIRGLGFSRLHVFPYSEHEKAPARLLPGKVKQSVITERAGRLRELNGKLMADYRARFAGAVEEVVVERRAGRGRFAGTGEHYFDTEFDADQIGDGDARIGGIARVRM